MNRRIFLLFALIASLPHGVYGQGQSTVTDSLERKLSTVNGESKVDILNLLTYEFITHDSVKVENYNKQALDLSKSIKYIKGEAKAYTYRGVYEYLSGHLHEGHTDLNRGLALAIKAGDEHLRGYCLLQLGVCSLEEIEMDSALRFFKKSREVFKDSTDPGTLSKIYRNMSALYGQRYQTDSQQFYLDRAIRIRRLLPDKVLLAEAIILKANINVRLGDFNVAEELLKDADEIVGSDFSDEENHFDILHMRALILFQKGKFHEAVVLSDSVRSYFFKKNLIRKYITLLIDLGNVFANRGEYELALNNLYDALKLSKLRGFYAEIGIIRIEIGWINDHLGNVPEAVRMADEALQLGPRKLLRGDLADALSLKGVALTELKDYNNSRIYLDSALSIYADLGSLEGKSEAHRSLGYLEGQRKKYAVALEHYRESIRLAESIHYAYGLAWSYWGVADIYFRQDNFTDAMHFLDISLTYARRADSNDVIVANYNTRRDILTSQGHFEEALKFSTLANALNDSLHHTDVARRFESLEQVQEIEQRNRDIRVLQQDKLIAEDKLKLQNARLEQQSTLLIAGVIGLLLISALAVMYYRFYLRVKTLNVSITEKNRHIQVQADQLKEYNQNISEINRSLEKIVAEKTLELRRTNEELVKYNSELLQFSYTVSHNLRGPVARLLGLAVLANKETDVQQMKQLVGFIDKTAHDLDLIIKDLGKLLELRNNPNQFHETVKLAAEWDQSKSLLQDVLTGHEQIVANFDNLPEITAVRSMIQSVFYNLLSNAIKFQSPDRLLTVTASSKRVNGKAVLQITDNGLGFNIRLHHEKLFKLYKRFHTHVEGRGLGLYLVKSQVDVLHGTIEVDSAPDKGSTFKVTLPLQHTDTEKITK
jgi:signal transduction histidine kinase